MKRTTDGFSELQIVTKAVGFLAILTGVLYLRAMVGEGALVFEGSIAENDLLLLFLALATAGLLAAWWQQAVGGVIAVLSALVVAAIVYATGESNRLLEAFIYGSPFLIAGGLFVACAWRARRQ